MQWRSFRFVSCLNRTRQGSLCTVVSQWRLRHGWLRCGWWYMMLCKMWCDVVCNAMWYDSWCDHFDGLVQEIRNFSALAMELRLSCTSPSNCDSIFTVLIWILVVELVWWFILIFKALRDSRIRNFKIVLLVTWTRCWTKIRDAMSLKWCHSKTCRMLLCCYSSCVYIWNALLFQWISFLLEPYVSFSVLRNNWKQCLFLWNFCQIAHSPLCQWFNTVLKIV